MTQNEVRIEYVPLKEILRAPRNPKDHDIGAIIQSMLRFGFVTPGVLNETTGNIVVGHGRADALASLQADGADPPDRVQVAEDGDWLVPLVRGVRFKSDEEAEAYLVADNQLTSLGGWHDNALLEVLMSLGNHDPSLLEVTGFDDGDIQEIAGRTGTDLIDMSQEGTSRDNSNLTVLGSGKGKGTLCRCEIGQLMCVIERVLADRLWTHIEHAIDKRAHVEDVLVQGLDAVGAKPCSE